MELLLTLISIIVIVIFLIILKKIHLKIRNDKVVIENSFDELRKHFYFSSGYLNQKKLLKWKNKHTKILQEMFHGVSRLLIFQKYYKEVIRNTNEFNHKAEQKRIDRNHKFVESELISYREMFSNIEGKELDIQQRKAIIIDEDNNLVIAGAGSGKTTTIIGKVKYILARYEIDPNEILLISFTKKSSTTLAQRININGVIALTFHKFGLEIINTVEKVRPSICDENNFHQIISSSINTLIEDEDYLKILTEYFLYYRNVYKSDFKFNNQGEYFQYLKDMDFRAFIPSAVTDEGNISYNYEIVKSYQECQIANFLFSNRVFYFYEEQYPFVETNYKPDFTIVNDTNIINGNTEISQYTNKVFLEHFGIDRNHDIPKFFVKYNESYENAKRKYLRKMDWAVSLHRRYGTRLIETFSYEFDEGCWAENLKHKLLANGINLDPMTPKEIWEKINQDTPKDYENFYKLITTFIVLLKSNNVTIEEARKKATLIKDDYFKKRSLLILNIIEPIFHKYQETLLNNNQIDFSDMINKATNYLLQGRYNKRFKYLIIDEFQDISISRYKLIQAVIERNPECKTFCVGDDWQSIFRFTGSDNGLFKNFSNYFGKTEISLIETTYRFGIPLLTLSNEFIIKNPYQTKKELKSVDTNKRTDFQIINYNSLTRDGLIRALNEAFKEIVRRYPNYLEKEILVLGRYNFDFKDLERGNNIFTTQNDSLIYQSPTNNVYINSKYLTVHKAKGLEADIVIVINFKAGQYGFPSQISDDPVLDLILSDADQFENSEERRLFYVALTRAKEHVYLLVPEKNQSKFITEVKEFNNRQENGNIRICPQCKTTELRFKQGETNGRRWAFWGCPNYYYGCDYTETN